MRKVFFILVLIAATMTVAPARADIDQRCLGLCINSGKSSTQCLEQCAYGRDAQPKTGMEPTGHNAKAVKPPPPPSEMSHEVFKAPVPSNETILPPKHASMSAQPSKDYHCVTACMQKGGQYSLCSDRCTRVSCEAGSPLCKDLRGSVPKSVMTNPALTPGAGAVPVSSSAPQSYLPH
jgi:hypothetical protein